jgi:hypothetical protein
VANEVKGSGRKDESQPSLLGPSGELSSERFEGWERDRTPQPPRMLCHSCHFIHSAKAVAQDGREMHRSHELH